MDEYISAIVFLILSLIPLLAYLGMVVFYSNAFLFWFVYYFYCAFSMTKFYYKLIFGYQNSFRTIRSICLYAA